MINNLSAGWASVSITPHGKSVSLAGQYYERITNKIDCELMASALVLQSNNESFTWVTCDVVGITDKLLEAVKDSVAIKAPEINTENIILSAIHTHNAPFIKYNNILGRSGYFKEKSGLMSDMEYHEFAVERITSVVLQANNKIKNNFSLLSGTVNIRTGCCRRGILKNGKGVMYIDTTRPDFLRMEGPDGGPVGVLYLNDNEGALKGIVACIPCTAQILEHEFVVSSDYVGRVRQMLCEKFGEDFIFLPLISAAGDLSPRNLITKDYCVGNMYKASGADEFAKRIFNGLISEYKDNRVKKLNIKKFRVTHKKVVLPGWIPSQKDYEWAKDIITTDEIHFNIDDYVQKGIEPYYNQPLAVAKKAESILMKYEDKSKYETLEIDLKAICLDDIVLVTNPFELFIEYGNRIVTGAKAKSVWPVQLVDGYEGYFPTSEAVKAGGYSAYIQSVRVEPAKAGEILVEESIKLINSLT